ncbi:glycosyl transferase [Salipaludibacillus keqinensis]|uniref:Glycosyl transferase n=1 Tax=Salipaludibacillus keqinensis TaxID=2045207 RepID=A0A323TZP9_9BACI|nr:capsular polysaccharide synthesis protein [Salipaludibacillus keqinensis]PYZ95075.1 glycosyl transferase [Salipaludibacillus keqinensis]
MEEISTSIPKIIHYCWFGRKEKPQIVQKCIASWRNHLQDYQIIEWNEENFNLNINRYVKEAYETKNYAFVSDYVRVYALFNDGGIYLDTDVEVYKSFDDLLHHHSFWGFEQENYIATSTIGSSKGNEFIKSFLDSYDTKGFINDDGSKDTSTNVAIVTKMLLELGLKQNGDYQELEGLGAFYPQHYFSPYDYINCRNFKTKDSYCTHHFHKSWLSPKDRLKSNMKLGLSKVIGGNTIYKFRRLASKF